MKAGTRRLFVGIALDPEARRACAVTAERLRATGFAAKYEDPAKFHVTLAFLGNVETSRTDEVRGSLRDAAAAVSPFEFVLDKLGAFPHERRPRVVYAGAREQGPSFRRLAFAVRETYEILGFRFDADDVAHVTLARAKDSRQPVPLVDVEPSPVRCTHLTLFESIFDKERNTSHYEMLDREVLLKP